MGLKRHTLIVVPHDGSRFRKLRFSSRLLILSLGLAVALSAAAGFSLWYQFSDKSFEREAVALREENEALRQSNREFESTARQLEDRLRNSEDRTRELAIIAGVEQMVSPIDETPAASSLGIGGWGSPEDLLPDLPGMRLRAQRLGGVLDQVDYNFELRNEGLTSRPSVMPVKGVLTSGYGYRPDPISGSRAFHTGIDISAPPGNEVRATADGVVARVGSLGALGRAVVLSHGFGYSTRYGHLAEITVQPGDKVARGGLIGRVGRSGRATGYHVHYEVHVDGRSRNPLEFILDQNRDR